MFDDSCIINQLRTKSHIHHNGVCNQSQDDVQHVLYDCVYFNQARQALFQYLNVEFNRFQEQQVLFDIKSLLYPHLTHPAKELSKYDNIYKSTRCKTPQITNVFFVFGKSAFISSSTLYDET